MKHCCQKPNELVTDFLERFQQVWKSSLDLPMENKAVCMILTLVNNLQTHVRDLFMLRCTSWVGFDFSAVRDSLSEMERIGMFDSKRKAQHLAECYRSGLQGFLSGQLELPAPPSSTRRPRRDKRRDQCYYCSIFGHWARECRDKFKQHNFAVWYY